MFLLFKCLAILRKLSNLLLTQVLPYRIAGRLLEKTERAWHTAGIWKS